MGKLHKIRHEILKTEASKRSRWHAGADYQLVDGRWKWVPCGWCKGAYRRFCRSVLRAIREQ